MILKENELKEIKAGMTSALMNAVVKGLSLLIDLGKSLGSAIRRVATGKMCKI